MSFVIAFLRYGVIIDNVNAAVLSLWFFIMASKAIFMTGIQTAHYSVKTYLPTHGSIQSADTACGKVFLPNF
jgi:hypothetical protein